MALATWGAALAAGVTLNALAASERPDGEPATWQSPERKSAAEPTQHAQRGSCAGDPITQSVNPNIVAGPSVWCGTQTTNAETSLARSFVATANVTIGCVELGILENFDAPWLVHVRVLQGSIGGPYANLTLLAETPVLVPTGTSNEILTADIPDVQFVAGTEYVVELHVPSRVPADGGDGGLLALGCNNLGETAPTYIRAPACGATSFIPLSAIGFGDRHLVLTLFTTPAGGAGIVGEALGAAAPPDVVGGTVVVPFPPDEERGYDPSLGIQVEDVPGVLGHIDLDHALQHLRVGSGWDGWGHGYAGDVYVSNTSSATITLQDDSRAFVLYVDPTSPGTVSVTANDGTSVSQSASGEAVGFAFYATADTDVTTLTIQAPSPFAVGEFKQQIPPAELHVDFRKIGDCCWEFDIGQYAGGTGAITEVLAQVTTGNVSVISAAPACGPGPAPTITATSAQWLIPPGLVATWPFYVPTCTVQICFSSPVSSSFTVVFTGRNASTIGNPPQLTRSMTLYDPDCAGQSPYPVGCNVFYTTDADFDRGTLLSVNHDPHDQLQVDSPARPLPYIAIPCSARGTVVRLDVNTGQALGEYLSAPQTAGLGRDPSRTTVDLEGNVWVTNRGQGFSAGSAIKIGICVGGTRGVRTGSPGSYVFTPNPTGQWVLNPSYHTCVDRDNDGLIYTSRALGNILPWPDASGAAADAIGGGIVSGVAQGGNAQVQWAHDEAILIFQRTHGYNDRHLSCDENGDVWVGGYNGGPNFLDRLDGDTGAIFTGSSPWIAPACGLYGGLQDCTGVVWSASPHAHRTWRYPGTGAGLCISIPYSYGLGIDSCSNIWNSSYQIDPNDTRGRMYKLGPAGNILVPGVLSGGKVSTGLAVTLTPPAVDHVWVANRGTNDVSRLNSAGVLLPPLVNVGSYPTGVAVDTNGKVWVTNKSGGPNGNAQRIVPGAVGGGTVDLTKDLGKFTTPFSPSTALECYPYTYGDMTGLVALNATAGLGRWYVIQDSENPNQCWGRVTWNTEAQGYIPAGGAIIVEVRAANTVAGLTSQPWTLVSSGATFTNVIGRYIQVRATLKSGPAPNPDPNCPACERVSPVLSDLRIECCKFVRVVSERIRCKCPAGTGYNYTFVIQNQTSTPISTLYFFPQTSGISITPNPVTFLPAINPGWSRTVNVTITGGSPGAQVCFELSDNDFYCCRTRHCIKLPPCDCAQLIDERLLTQVTPNTFLYSFKIANTWGPSISHAILMDASGGPTATFSPSCFEVALPPCSGSNAPVSATLQSLITVTPTPSTLFFRLVLISPDVEGACCITEPRALEIPAWGPPGRCCYTFCPYGYLNSTISSAAQCAALGGGQSVFLVNPNSSCLHCWPWNGGGVQTLGLATLNSSIGADPALFVDGIGGTGNDGIRAETGPLDSFAVLFAEIDPLRELPTGAHLEVRAVTASGQVLAAARGTQVGNGVLLEVDPFMMSAYHLRARNAGALVLDLPGRSGPIGVAADWFGRVALGDDDAGHSRIAQEFTVPMIFSPPGGPPVVIDELEIVAENSGNTLDAMAAFEVLRADVPEFTLLDVVKQPLGPAGCTGDMNCDGVVDFFDIDIFVEALSHPGGAGWPYPNCPWSNADANGDGNVDFFDIDAFVGLIGATCP